ncbi:hypothetical protein NKH48_35240, partial [Mesorhizobium sp. M1233]|uniref:hypothetical protein n=1 Tax=Mesorhizobium sp. M1233 TaxID=2957072 RepID=UPI003337F000
QGQCGKREWRAFRYLLGGGGRTRTLGRVVGALAGAGLAAGAPEELRALLTSIVARLTPAAPAGA